MHLIFEPAQLSITRNGQYLQSDDRSVFAYDAGITLLDWVDAPQAAQADAPRLVLHDDVGHTGASPDDDARSWLASWSQSGWERFDSAYRQARSRADALGIELLIQPSSRGMLSDAISTLNWCTRGGGQDATLLLDPIGWVVPSMMRDLPDHLDRINELCLEMIEHGRVGLLLLRAFEWASLTHGGGDTAQILGGLSESIQRAPAIAVLDERDLALLGRSTTPNR